MKTLYIIPARGGSKGVPGKNIKSLGGKPLIQYSIEVARTLANDIDICVSTDDDNIAKVVESIGLKIPFMRPDHLAADNSGTYEVIIHALDFYASQGVVYDTIVLLQPTTPFRTTSDVERCIEKYNPALADMVVSVKEASSNPYYNCFEENDEGYLHISKGDGLYTRRQDAPKAWEYNGAVYVINVESLRKMRLGEFKHRIMCEMDSIRSIDIDNEIDWIIAETLISTGKI